MPTIGIDACLTMTLHVTSVLKNAWGIPFQILTRAHGQVTSTADFGGHVTVTASHPPGDNSGDIAGQGSTFTLF